LRERRDDIDALVDHFVPKLARELKKPQLRISAAARERLRAHDWPGNIRELENALERAAILCDAATIEPRDLTIASTSPETLDLSGTLDEAGSRLERFKIAEALRTSLSRAAAADILGISPRTLAAKMKEHGLDE
jgi:DNA-binding NtrC family response regulator